MENIAWGGQIRESILLKILEKHYQSKFRRQWELGEKRPQFEDQRIFFFNFAFSRRYTSSQLFNRGSRGSFSIVSCQD